MKKDLKKQFAIAFTVVSFTLLTINFDGIIININPQSSSEEANNGIEQQESQQTQQPNDDLQDDKSAESMPVAPEPTEMSEKAEQPEPVPTNTIQIKTTEEKYKVVDLKDQDIGKKLQTKIQENYGEDTPDNDDTEYQIGDSAINELSDDEQDDAQNDTEIASINVDVDTQMILCKNSVSANFENAQVMISKDVPEDSINEPTTISLSDALNEDTEEENSIKYINLSAGVYVFNFVNCTVDDITVMFIRSFPEELENNSDDKQFDDEITLDEEGYNANILLTDEKSSYVLKIFSSYSVYKMISITSELSVDGMLFVEDENRSVIDTIEMDEDPYDNNVSKEIYFEQEKIYYLQIDMPKDEVQMSESEFNVCIYGTNSTE